MSARDEVLGRIRQALAGSDPAPAVPREYRTTGEHPYGAPALLDLLTDRLVDYRAAVHPCTPPDLPATLAMVLTGLGVHRLAVPPGLDPRWLAPDRPAPDRTGLDRIGPALIGPPGRGLEVLADAATPLDVATLDGVDGVLTACAVAIADTGTIVLDDSPDQGRRALTLVPDLHVVVVHADQVVQTVPEALARLDPKRPVTMISGPSATSDIELQRVEGVHGPRNLVAVLVRPDGPAGPSR